MTTTRLFKHLVLAQIFVFVVVFAIPLPNNKNKDVHYRVKRQYFKPSIDGNILGDERKVVPIKSASATKQTSSSSSSSTTSSDTSTNSMSSTSSTTFALNSSPSDPNSSLTNNNNSSVSAAKFNEVTVTSLSLSLINLFDRVKGTLCQIIGQNCK